MSVRSLLKVLPFKRFRRPPAVVGVLRLSGVIGALGPLRAGLDLAGLAVRIERLFKLSDLTAVALVINSPGGAPVQASLIHDRLRALADENDLPVHVFIEDVAASGGYWLACAGDHIHADPSSIVGSIGVVSAGFGFPGLLERFGIERRVHTAGPRKAMLDPFRPERPEDVVHLEALQADIHDRFKALVRTRRAGRLRADEDLLFSGAFWTGRQALALGLIDGLGDLRTVLRERYGKEVKLRLVEPPRPWLRRRLGLSGAGGPAAGWPAGAVAAIEERLMWGRYGL